MSVEIDQIVIFQVYLLDYGLAYRYCPYGKHVAHKEDANRKHDGTVEYTSRDAHKGLGKKIIYHWYKIVVKSLLSS